MYQPHEHVLELTRGHIIELSETLHSMNGVPKRAAMRDYTIWPMNDEVSKELDAVSSATQSKQRATMWHQPQ